MVSVTCPCVECMYHGERNKCKAKNINLTYRNMATINEGRVDMWICDKYELSAEAKEIADAIAKVMGGTQHEDN